MPFRVLTAQFMHETNTFATVKTDVAAFERIICCRGADEIVGHLKDTNTETAGYIDVAEAHGWEQIHTVAAAANPLGLVTDETFEHFVGLMTTGLEEAGPVDGIALALHGAMVSESHEDAETEIVRRLRTIAGPDIPICCTFDLHANVGPDFVEMVQIVCSYLTYPHIDMRERARKAGDLLQRAMAGEIKPKLVYARRPMVQGADGGRTDVEPMIGLRAKADAAMASDPRLLDISINAGFNQSDIFDVGPSVIVTADGDDPAFTGIAEDLMDDIWEARHVINNRYLRVGEAAEVARSFNYRNRPLVIADYADNPGAGAYGDATNLLAAMLDARLDNACFGALYDPAAAADLTMAGLGVRMTLHLGGKTDPAFGGPPLLLTGDIVSLTDGVTTFDGPMMAGVTKSFGPTAVFRVDGIDILVVSNLMQITDLQQFLAHGIDPSEKKTVALKSMQHFRATYEPLAEKVIVCDSGALATPDFTRFTFRNARRPMFPFDPDEAFFDTP
ncbi:MAG: microcystin degradation protein MlrC [Rhodospirillaceae bacterium]|nr:microcystin degradation protein MlrC [Rhodospirillaceae bacterium]